MTERTFVAIAHGHRMALEQASHNNNASTFRHYASSAIKRLEEWAPTLDELEAMVCAMTPEEAKACRKRAGLPEVTTRSTRPAPSGPKPTTESAVTKTRWPWLHRQRTSSSDVAPARI
jgi:hypothetical protein